MVAEFDGDGANACAVGVRGVTLLGARVGVTLVPDGSNTATAFTPTSSGSPPSVGPYLLVNGRQRHRRGRLA